MPDSTSAKLEKLPSTTSRCLRLFRKLVIQINILLSMSLCSNFPSKPACNTVSIAFEKSRMATSIWDLEFKEDNKPCVVVISCVSQLLPDRKPCWRLVRILWSSTSSRMCLQTMCSKSLQVIQVRETGL